MPELSHLPPPGEGTAVFWATVRLAVAATVVSVAVQMLLSGADGCGATSGSAAGQALQASYWVVPTVAAVWMLGDGLLRRMRMATIATGVLATVLLSVTGEIAVLWYLVAANHCTQ